MLVKDIINEIEGFAPLVYQESYDNAGLQVGNPAAEATGVLVTLDVTEPVLDEAIENGCNMVVSHHPVIFSGLKGLTGRNYVERIVQKAIKNDINIYSAHTNLDNMRHGVNDRIADKLGLENRRILSAIDNALFKLYTYVPLDAADKVREAMFAAGAGAINKYSECSFNTEGRGTFRAAADANPAIGEAGGGREHVREMKIEVVVEKHRKQAVLKAMFDSHPYEEVAYELIALDNKHQELGAGMIGTLPQPMAEQAFLAYLKDRMKTGCIRHTPLSGRPVQKVALCGGSGSFLLKNAIAGGADVFITGDFKYHQFFDAEGRIVVADIGHYESEQFTVEIFAELLNKKFPNFAILLSKIDTNPVKYFY